MKTENDFQLQSENSQVLGLAYGLGVDSTAVIVGLVKKGIRPDFILFADVGCEKQSTYNYLPIIQEYLKAHNFPAVTIVRYQPKTAPYTTLEGNMVMNATLPGAAFNRASCTHKFKIIPQQKYEKEYYGSCKIIKMVGFEAGEEYRRNRASDKAHTQKDERYEYQYPLIEWGWNREECKARIKEAGLPVPAKSSCIFCPNMKPNELSDLTAEELGRVIRVEVVAEPYNREVEGLWRKTRIKQGLPGSMTEYIVKKGLHYVHPDKLPVMSLNANCLKGKRGFTFNAPHVEYRLSEMIGGCECAKVEHHFHSQIIDDMKQFELKFI